MIMQVVLIGSSDANPEQCAVAEEVGALIARMGHVLVTGGRSGVMEAAARGCHRENGISVGILPGQDFSGANKYNTINIPSGIGYGRNMTNILACHVAVVVAGQAGTLNEMTYAWMYNKPVIAMTGTGGWADKLAGKTIDERKDEQVIPCSSIEELETLLSRMG